MEEQELTSSSPPPPPPPPSSPPLSSQPPPPMPLQSAVTDTETEARRLKILAEEKIKASSLKSALKYARRARSLFADLDGLDSMVTALKVLRSPPSDHYKVLRCDPLSPFATVKKSYKTLAQTLQNPNPSHLSARALTRVADSFAFLSGRRRKRDFDFQLRLDLAAAAAGDQPSSGPVETFWTTCATCRLLHEFDRRYLGHRLVCPSCRKSFLALEAKLPAEKSNLDSRVRVTAARSRSNSRPRVPAGWTGFDRKRKVMARPEKTLAEIQSELVTARKKKKEKAIVPAEENNGHLSAMAVEDSDFYDFDKDRTEKSFVKGQIWAIYDDDDGMPRHYGLIDEVISSNPFKVKMSWLDLYNNEDEALLLWEKSGYHISCGRFKVARKVDIHSVNLFSHSVLCERATREMYRIFPKKGSVWAMYGGKNSVGEESRCYDIVVFLTTYSEMYGLSMAFLVKVSGFKTIFKRAEIGCHAVRWLEKDNVRLFSHQIPARKITDVEGVDLPKDCWELDPASLPPDLLRIGWER